MTALADRLRPIWPFLTLAASAAMLAAAHLYFQRYLGLTPCPLCLDQRNWHWAVVAVSVVAAIAVRLNPKFVRWTILFIGLVLLGSAAQGAYHVAVEQHWVIAQCDARMAVGDIRPLDFDGSFVVPKCDEIAWSMWGISMAGWNALICLLLALASFVVAALPERNP